MCAAQEEIIAAYLFQAVVESADEAPHLFVGLRLEDDTDTQTFIRVAGRITIGLERGAPDQIVDVVPLAAELIEAVTEHGSLIFGRA